MKKLIPFLILLLSFTAVAQKKQEAYRVIGEVTSIRNNVAQFKAHGKEYECAALDLKVGWEYIFYFTWVDKDLQPKKVKIIGHPITNRQATRLMDANRKELDKNYKIKPL